MSIDSKKTLVRALSGAVYVAIIVGCTLGGSPWFMALVALLTIMASVEYSKMTIGLKPRNVLVVTIDTLGCLCLAFGFSVMSLALWLACMIFRFVYELYAKNPNPIHSLSRSMLGQVWIGVPMGCMAALGVYSGMFNLVLAIFIMIWLNDTGAFLVGSMIGKHRLFERISPKKSWEGFWGSMVFCVGAAILLPSLAESTFNMSWGLGAWIGLGIVVCVFSTWGDLVESMIKRTLHLKDSGHIIPGHGGILDRIDSALMVMPASLLYVFFVVYWF